jgi:glycosyltransferase involved in cell wall biosynthesis
MSMESNPPGFPHVLMVTGEYPPQLGGVGDYTELLCSHLATLGGSPFVLTNRGLDSRVTSIDQNEFKVIRDVEGWGPGSWEQIVSAAAKCRARIVHIQYQAAAYDMNPAVNTLPAYLRVRLPGSRVITTFHDLRVPYIFPKAGPLRRAAIHTLDRLSHATVVTNRADLSSLEGADGELRDRPFKRWLIPLGSNVRCAPPPGYDRAVWRAKIGADERTLVLSYFGFMNESKGVDVLVDSVASLMERGIRASLLMVGGETGVTDPTNRAFSVKVKQSIAAHRLDSRVLWTGFASAQDVSAYLLSSDVCVLPFRDGVSLRRGSLLAALTHGLAVVTTMPDGAEPLLRNGENIAMVKRNDPTAIADAVEYLWRDEGRRRQLSMGAQLLAARFKWPDIAAKHMEMYETVLSQRQAERLPLNSLPSQRNEDRS